MKKQIAQWLLKIAKCLDHDITVQELNGYEPLQLGLGYHISKSDVRKFRNEHPEYSSHRKGLEALINDTKTVILGNIVRGISDNNCIEYNVKKTFWTANVTGKLNIYMPVGTEIHYTNGKEECDEDQRQEVQ